MKQKWRKRLNSKIFKMYLNYDIKQINKNHLDTQLR